MLVVILIFVGRCVVVHRCGDDGQLSRTSDSVHSSSLFLCLSIYITLKTMIISMLHTCQPLHDYSIVSKIPASAVKYNMLTLRPNLKESKSEPR